MDTTIRKLKAMAALKNVTVGDAINDAMKLWIAKKNNGKNRL